MKDLVKVYNGQFSNRPIHPIGTLVSGFKKFKGMNVYINGYNRTRSCMILGKTGSGKSQLTLSIYADAFANGDGSLVFDINGELIKDILTMTKDRYDDIIYLDLDDNDFSVNFNPSLRFKPMNEIGEIEAEELFRVYYEGGLKVANTKDNASTIKYNYSLVCKAISKLGSDGSFFDI